ncbi:MAG: endonuclease [Acidobacteriota bacterium]|jgi:endonuclease-3|nr:endonuclease [Acidobacteriota bacterium]
MSASSRRSAKEVSASPGTQASRPAKRPPHTPRTERSHATEKPLRYIIQNLERTYGVPVNKRSSDPLDMLIAVILSQATSDTNSDRTFAALKKRFPTWESLLRARISTIVSTIRSGGLANQKAVVIREVLQQIKEEHGTLDLGFLHDVSPEQAVDYLSQFRGIGPKTIACTLLFACRKEVFPLDTHIFRVLRRIGIVPQKCTDRHAHEIMNGIVPKGKFYSFHVNLIRHGRKLCRPREPLCERCPIVEYCDYGQGKV